MLEKLAIATLNYEYKENKWYQYMRDVFVPSIRDYAKRINVDFILRQYMLTSGMVTDRTNKYIYHLNMSGNKWKPISTEAIKLLKRISVS